MLVCIGKFKVTSKIQFFLISWEVGLDKDINHKKQVKKSIPLTLESLEKIRGDGPSYQDYIDSLPQEDLDKYRDQRKISERPSALKLKGSELESLAPDWLNLSLRQIKALTDDELQKLLSGEGHKGGIRDSTIQLISNEVLIRQIRESSKPHWTVIPIFIVSCIAAVAAIAAIAVTIYFSMYQNSNNGEHTKQGDTIENNGKP